MSKTFAIGDIHGRFDLLSEAVRRIEEASPAGGKIVFLGDYIDRGPQSREVIETLMAGPSNPTRWTWVCLKGNHEDMMVSTIHGPDESWWIENGGAQTVASFGGTIPSSVLEWAAGLPMHHSDGKRLFVHAGADPTKPIDEQSEAILMWFRYTPATADVGYPDLHVVHGHTPMKGGPFNGINRTNIDTGAVYDGSLTVAIFDDDLHGGPRSFISLAS